MDDIQGLIAFLRVSMKMKETYRFTPKGDGFESDADHSWNVALICMLLTDSLEKEFGQVLDSEKMLKMALIHDLAEVFTGDTKTWDRVARINKDEKERLAINEVVEPLPDDLRVEILKLWEECETRSSLEAKIVKSIDRLEPVLHRVLLNYGWSNVENDGDNGTIEALDERQLPRHEFSNVITELFLMIRDEASTREMFKVPSVLS